MGIQCNTIDTTLWPLIAFIKYISHFIKVYVFHFLLFSIVSVVYSKGMQTKGKASLYAQISTFYHRCRGFQ